MTERYPSNMAATEGYCMKCRTRREITDAKRVTLKNGRPALEGTCPVCGTKMVKLVSGK